MLDDRERRAHRIFVAALDIDEAERPAFVAAGCGDDDALRAIVEELLGAVHDSTTFLETPAISHTHSRPATTTTTSLPETIDGFRVIRRLGAGGMAAVYEAEQETPQRRVAIKVLHSALIDTSALDRFRFEGDVLARLNHPAIARIHACGTCADAMGDPVPYFAMEYIPGARTLSEFATEQVLTTRERLQLFACVCDAVQHGHQLGVIHRDLKPGNILVDGDGNPHIIDFGVAATVAPGGGHQTISADRRHLVGTLNYMSPEQCSDEARIDTRSDVYSLGVVLYELITKARPHDLSSSSIVDAVRIVQTQSPTRPDHRDPSVAPELSAIVMKALEKEPPRRYATASELAADVRRFLDDRPVLARPASTMQQLRLFVRRNRGPVAAAITIAGLLVAGIFTTTRLAMIADSARNDAEDKQAVLERVVSYQESQLNAIDVSVMGDDVRAALVATLRRSLETDPDFEGDIEATVATFEVMTDRVNFTTLALDAVHENILERSRASIDRDFADDPIVRARLLYALARTMGQLGRPEDAEHVLAHALAIRQAELGPEHADTLRARHSLGALVGTLGRQEEALEHLQFVVDARSRQFGPEAPPTLSTMNSIGGVLRRSGDIEGAERVWRETLDARRRILGEDHPETLMSLNNMGVAYAIQGKFDEAEVAWRELVDQRARLHGRHDTRYLDALGNLGLLLLSKGDLEGAPPLLAESLAALRAADGDDHPDTLVTMGSVVDLLVELGDLEAAEPLARENLAGRRRRFGDDHQDTLRAQASLSAVVALRGNADEAEALMRDVIETQRRALGPDHPDLIPSTSVLAAQLADQDRFDESEALHREAIAAAEDAHGDMLALCLGRYGTMLTRAERWDEAEAVLVRGYDLLLELRGAGDGEARKMAERLVTLYEAMAGDRAVGELERWRQAAQTR